MNQHSLLHTLNLLEICLIQHRELATFVTSNTTLGIHHVFITKFTFKKKTREPHNVARLSRKIHLGIHFK